MNSSTDITARIANAKQGDESSLGELLASYEKYLKMLAQLQLGKDLRGKVDASDVVQETFLEAHRGIGQFQGDNANQLMAWLRAILANRLAHTMRHYLGTQARDIRLEQRIHEALDRSAMSLGGMFVDPHSSPSQHVAKDEMSRLVIEALARLPEDYRDVLVMRHLEGLTFREISEHMQRSIDSVEKLWLRGLGKLKKEFAGAERKS
jgi:RNA polymerase sigma-70 factor (ECF subfamily)